jgi:3'(2'), 5'-bisphosphate nucleotidase
MTTQQTKSIKSQDYVFGDHALPQLATALIPIAKAAGNCIMQIYNSGNLGETLKSDQTPLTLADKAAHHQIKADLQSLTPGIPIVSEEDDYSHVHRDPTAPFWLIDPLDGTKEFIAHSDEFTVNIALINQGKSILGVVYAPALDCLYLGGEGVTAARIQGDQTTEIHCAASENAKVLRVIASKSHLNAETTELIEKLISVHLIQAGSSLKFCKIAEGSADIYPRLAPTSEWDTAAAQAVLEAAGGHVVDLTCSPLRYGKSDINNPAFIATRDLSIIPQ